MSRVRTKKSEEPAPAKCLGQSKAWGARLRGEEHEAYKPLPPCRLCGADMGCVRCSGHGGSFDLSVRELLCSVCKDWAHPAGFIEHGRMLRSPEERHQGVMMLQSAVAAILARDTNAPPKGESGGASAVVEER